MALTDGNINYPKGYMNYNKNFIQKMFDPDFQMRTTIGSGKLLITIAQVAVLVP